MNNAIQEKRPELANRKGIMFHHDMTMRNHTHLCFGHSAKIIILELGWDVLPHPPYSIVLTLHHQITIYNISLFAKLNFLNGKNFNNDDDVKLHLVQFFADNIKTRSFIV